ncbi:MAG: hypothetical protein SV375_10925, partial [Thermodesulfobacteriota bacterium]|nr:hypothetical protein [Thermodesulfobacteriota bacterium]
MKKLKITFSIVLPLFISILMSCTFVYAKESSERTSSPKPELVKLNPELPPVVQSADKENRQSNVVFFTALGAALGGFLGASIWFFVRFLIERWRPKKDLIKTYLCASNINVGDNNEVDGELKHHHGKRVDDQFELQRIEVSNPLWEWSREPAGVGSGGSVIYGPYSTDFTESGKYSVTFRIRGMGFTQPKDITRDVPILLLDVNRSIERYVPVDGKIINLQAQNRFAVRYVRASELATGEWKDFELVFNCDGPGIWEYRVHAYDGVSLKPESINQFGASVRIFFDKVTISKVKKINIPW